MIVSFSTARTPADNFPDTIDLTGEDDEEEQLRQALTLSLGSAPTTTSLQDSKKLSSTPPQPSISVFGPSNRVDESQKWALVPSSQSKLGSKEDAKDEADEDLKRAMQASMNANYGSTRVDILTRPRGESCLG